MIHSICRYTASAIACVLLTVASASAQTTVQFDLPKQPLADALREFGRQANVNVLFDPPIVAAHQAPALQGQISSKEALTRLLKGTGLEYEFISERTVAIHLGKLALAKPTAALTEKSSVHLASAGLTAGDPGFWERFRLAQVDQRTLTNVSAWEKGAGQDSGQSSARLEEVVVTAQKREERLIDVPISIVALTGDELQNRRLTSLDDLQFAVPGMAVISDGIGNKIELRGVSNQFGAASLVGMYLDEVDVTNSGGLQINPNTYDLERVEVLRGPQGTLYGEGSAGGTVRFITKSPMLDRFAMTASAESLFTQDGSPGQRINTAVNVPLIDQQLAIRIVGTYEREGGWIDQPDANRKDINGQDLTNVRIKGLWQPSPQFSASFLAELYRNDRSTGTDDDVAGNFTQVLNQLTSPRIIEDHDIYNVTLTYEFPVAKILSTTSYLREELEGRDTGYVYTLPPPETRPGEQLNPYTLSDDHAWIEELRLSSIGSEAWQWTVGGFYRNYRDVYGQPVGYYGLLGPPGTELPASYGSYLADTLYKSWSVFGDVNYKLSDRLTLGFGIRSFDERQDLVQVQDYGFGRMQIDKAGKFHSVDPRVYAQYKISRDVNVYASAAKGFRSGGFNNNIDHPTFAPEDVRTYELGAKMSLLKGQLLTETAIFYTDYKDYVVLGVQGKQLAALFNAGNARLKGIEWNYVWRPSDQWSLGITGDYIDSRFKSINVTSFAYQVGDPLDYVPKYQVTSSVERDFNWDSRQLSMRLDYTRRGRQTYRDRAQGLYSETEVTNLMGYYMTLHWAKNLSFNLFAQNLLNDRGLILPNNGSFERSRPRTYGAGFDISF